MAYPTIVTNISHYMFHLNLGFSILITVFLTSPFIAFAGEIMKTVRHKSKGP